MKSIKILGTGCAKCKQVETLVRDTVAEMGIEATVEKIEDIEQIIAYNVMVTPVLVIDEEVKIKGRVPSSAELRSLLA